MSQYQTQAPIAHIWSEAVCIENIKKVREGTEKKSFIIILEMAEDFNCLLDFWSQRRRQVTGQIVMETSNIQF